MNGETEELGLGVGAVERMASVGSVGGDSVALASNVAVLCLAAGCARRMGRLKQLLPWRDTTVLQAALRPYRDLNMQPLVLVVGANSAEIMESLEPGWRNICHLVRNERWREGMATSLVEGTRYLMGWERERNCRFAGVMVGLGDMPLLTASAIEKLLAAFGTGKEDRIVAPVWQGRRGHPVIIGREYWPELLELQGDRGAAPILRRHGDKVRMVEADEAVCRDVDTPEQWKALQEEYI